MYEWTSAHAHVWDKMIMISSRYGGSKSARVRRSDVSPPRPTETRAVERKEQPSRLIIYHLIKWSDKESRCHHARRLHCLT